MLRDLPLTNSGGASCPSPLCVAYDQANHMRGLSGVYCRRDEPAAERVQVCLRPPPAALLYPRMKAFPSGFVLSGFFVLISSNRKALAGLPSVRAVTRAVRGAVDGY